MNVDKSVTLKGAQAGNSADSRFAAFASTANGPKADPSAETIITAPFVDPTGSVGMPYDPPYDDLLRVTANNVTIDGFVLDGNNPLLDQTNALQVGGVNADARRAIDNIDSGGGFNNPVSNLQIVNNVIQNFGDRGISLYNNGTAPAVNNLVEGNVIRNFAGYGVLLFTNAYTDIENNTINGPTFATGIQLQNFYNVSDSMTWSGNDITVGQDGNGIVANLFYAPNATLNISGNTINAASGVTATDVNGFTWGVIVDSVQATSTVALTNNLIGNLPGSGQFDRGMDFGMCPPRSRSRSPGARSATRTWVSSWITSIHSSAARADSTVDLSNVAISGGTAGVVVNDTPLADDSFLVGPVDGGNPNIVAGSVTLNVSGGSITNATNGIEVEAPASGAFTATANVSGGASIVGGTTGILLSGANAALAFVGASPASLSGQSAYFIDLTDGADFDQTIDASQVSFSGGSFTGFVGAAHSAPGDLPTYYAIEDMIVDSLDNGTLGYVRLKTGNVFLAQSSETANAGAIERRRRRQQRRHRVRAGRHVRGECNDQ